MSGTKIFDTQAILHAARVKRLAASMNASTRERDSRPRIFSTSSSHGRRGAIDAILREAVDGSGSLDRSSKLDDEAHTEDSPSGIHSFLPVGESKGDAAIGVSSEAALPHKPQMPGRNNDYVHLQAKMLSMADQIRKLKKAVKHSKSPPRIPTWTQKPVEVNMESQHMIDLVTAYQDAQAENSELQAQLFDEKIHNVQITSKLEQLEAENVRLKAKVHKYKQIRDEFRRTGLLSGMASTGVAGLENTASAVEDAPLATPGPVKTSDNSAHDTANAHLKQALREMEEQLAHAATELEESERRNAEIQTDLDNARQDKSDLLEDLRDTEETLEKVKVEFRRLEDDYHGQGLELQNTIARFQQELKEQGREASEEIARLQQELEQRKRTDHGDVLRLEKMCEEYANKLASVAVKDAEALEAATTVNNMLATFVLTARSVLAMNADASMVSAEKTKVDAAATSSPRSPESLSARGSRKHPLLTSLKQSAAYKADVDTIIAEIKAMRSKVVEVEAQHSIIVSQRDKALEHQKKVESKLASSQKTVASLKQEKEALTRQCASLKEELEKLQKQGAEYEALVSAQTAEIADARAHAVNLATSREADIALLRDSLRDVHKSLAEKDEEIARLSQDVSMTTHTYDELEKAANARQNELNAEIARLQALSAEQAKTIASLRDSLSSTAGQHERLTSTLQTEHNKVSRELHAEQEKNAEMTAELTILRDSMNASAERIHSLSQTITELEEDLIHVKGLHLTLLSEKAGVEQECKTTKTALAESQHLIATLRAEITTLRSSLMQQRSTSNSKPTLESTLSSVDGDASFIINKPRPAAISSASPITTPPKLANPSTQPLTAHMASQQSPTPAPAADVPLTVTDSRIFAETRRSADSHASASRAFPTMSTQLETVSPVSHHGSLAPHPFDAASSSPTSTPKSTSSTASARIHQHQVIQQHPATGIHSSRSNVAHASAATSLRSPKGSSYSSVPLQQPSTQKQADVAAAQGVGSTLIDTTHDTSAYGSGSHDEDAKSAQSEELAKAWEQYEASYTNQQSAQQTQQRRREVNTASKMDDDSVAAPLTSPLRTPQQQSARSFHTPPSQHYTPSMLPLDTTAGETKADDSAAEDDTFATTTQTPPKQAPSRSFGATITTAATHDSDNESEEPTVVASGHHLQSAAARQQQQMKFLFGTSRSTEPDGSVTASPNVTVFPRMFSKPPFAAFATASQIHDDDGNMQPQVIVKKTRLQPDRDRNAARTTTPTPSAAPLRVQSIDDSRIINHSPGSLAQFKNTLEAEIGSSVYEEDAAPPSTPPPTTVISTFTPPTATYNARSHPHRGGANTLEARIGSQSPTISIVTTAANTAAGDMPPPDKPTKSVSTVSRFLAANHPLLEEATPTTTGTKMLDAGVITTTSNTTQAAIPATSTAAQRRQVNSDAKGQPQQLLLSEDDRRRVEEGEEEAVTPGDISAVEREAVSTSVYLVTHLTDEDLVALQQPTRVTDVVVVIAGAVCVLLGEHPSWVRAQEVLKQADFRSRIAAVDPTKVPYHNLKLIKNLIAARKLRDHISGATAQCDRLVHKAEFALTTWLLNVTTAGLAAYDRGRVARLTAVAAASKAASHSTNTSNTTGGKTNASTVTSLSPETPKRQRSTDIASARSPPPVSAVLPLSGAGTVANELVIVQLTADNAKLRLFVNALINGVQIEKIPTSTSLFRSKSQIRFLYLDKRSNRDAICWSRSQPHRPGMATSTAPSTPTAAAEEGDGSLLWLSDLTNVTEGLATETLRRRAKKEWAPLCLSLIAATRTLDIKCEDEDQKRWLLSGLQGIVAIVSGNRAQFLS